MTIYMENDGSPLLDKVEVIRQTEVCSGDKDLQNGEKQYPAVPLKKEDYVHPGAIFYDSEGRKIEVIEYNGAFDVFIMDCKTFSEKHVHACLLRKPGFTFRDKRFHDDRLKGAVARCYHYIKKRKSPICEEWKDKKKFEEWYLAQNAISSDHVCTLLSADPNAVMGPDNTILANVSLGKWLRSGLDTYYDSILPRCISFRNIIFDKHTGYNIDKKPAYMLRMYYGAVWARYREEYMTDIRAAFRKLIDYRAAILTQLESSKHLNLNTRESLVAYMSFKKSMLEGTFYPYDLERVEKMAQIEEKYKNNASKRRNK